MYANLLERDFLKPEDLEPDISGLEFYIDAFRELSTSRPVGLELQSIPFTAIVEYSKIYPTEDFDEFVYIIRSMDSEFIKLNEEASKSSKGNNGGGNSDKKNSNNR